AKEGWKFAPTERTQAPIEVAAREMADTTNRKVVPLDGDMSKHPDVQRCVGAALEQFGRLDILVNCAGSSPGGLLEDLTEEQWLTSVNLKFMGYVRAMTEAIPYMLRTGGGRIVNVIGNDGVKPAYFELTPSAANAADIAVTQALAEQYGPKGILINGVNPGPVATDRWDGLEKQIAKDKSITQDEAHALALKSLPLGR